MPLNLSKPTAGDVGWSAAINQNWTDIENQSNNQVTGPASATDNAVVRFDGTTGKLVQDGAVIIGDSPGQISWPAGGGAGTRILGPSDQELAIAGGAPADGNGGAVAISGAAGVGTNRNGGSVSLAAGAATGSGTPGDVNFSARGGSATFNQAGQTSLDAAYGSAGATSLIGALNVIAAGQVGGTITGPGSSTDNAVVRWDGTGGSVIQNSPVTISDTSGRINWATGGGGGTRILGPSDQDLEIAAESAGASSAGRALSLRGGPGGATSGAGGGASVAGGAAAGGNSAGGAASVLGGAGNGSSAGGEASLAGGAGGATGTGGAVTITGGTGGSSSGAGGAVTIAGGAPIDGVGGSVTVRGGHGETGDRAGGSVTISGGNANGSAMGGGVTIDTGGSDSGNPGSIVEKLNGKIRRVVIPPRTIADATTTTLVTISLASGERVGFSLATFLVSTDGTDHQAVQCTFYAAAVNKAGTYSSQIVSVTSPAANSGSASFSAYTPSIVGGTNEIAVRLNVNSSLSSPTMTVASVLEMHHSGTPTVTLP